eukprot:8399151-Heterocapsa_arctica.AAC.1
MPRSLGRWRSPRPASRIQRIRCPKSCRGCWATGGCPRCRPAGRPDGLQDVPEGERSVDLGD